MSDMFGLWANRLVSNGHAEAVYLLQGLMQNIHIQEVAMSDLKIREAIDRLGAAISADPVKARAKNAPSTARLTGGLKCEVTGPYGERLYTDMPPAMGGAASAPGPGWLL